MQRGDAIMSDPDNPHKEISYAARAREDSFLKRSVTNGSSITVRGVCTLEKDKESLYICINENNLVKFREIYNKYNKSPTLCSKSQAVT